MRTRETDLRTGDRWKSEAYDVARLSAYVLRMAFLFFRLILLSCVPNECRVAGHVCCLFSLLRLLFSSGVEG